MPPLNYTVTNTVLTTAQDSGSIRLFHGTRMEMAESIVEFGVNYGRAKACGASGEFWVTKVHEVAEHYSQLPPYVGASVILAFDLPEKSVEHCLQQYPEPWVMDHLDGRYQFFSPSYPVLNSQMTNITITINA